MIWIKESYIPEVQKHGALKAPRICRILSHREEGSEQLFQNNALYLRQQKKIRLQTLSYKTKKGR